MGNYKAQIDEDALDFLADMAGGDARNALNAIELGILTTPRSEDGIIHITLDVASQCIQKRVVRYDKNGDNHYDIISAFIKSMRGSDPDAAVYYLASETIENSRRLEYTVMFPYAGMRIYPHTRLAELAAREGVVAPDDDLLAPAYYIAPDFDLEEARSAAAATGKAWVFPDDPQSALVDTLRLKRNKKGPLWEYLRKP